MSVQEVTKEVVRPIYEVTEKIVEVPHTLVAERIQEVPKLEYVPLVKQVPKTQVREVQKQVGVPHYQARERVVEVPITMVAEQMVEVPQVQIQELVKEVPRPEVRVVPKPVDKPVNEYVERIVEVPTTTLQECIVEVPKVEIQEIVKQVPRPEVQTVDRQVEKLEVQYVEKVVEVPQIIYEECSPAEKIVEVPTVEVREVIKQETTLDPSMAAWLTTEHEMEMQAFVHQHLLSTLSPFSQRLKDLQDELEVLRGEMQRGSEQLRHTNTVVKQHGHELMTLTLDVNQAHTAVGALRKELVPEIQTKADDRKVEAEFSKVHEQLELMRADLKSYRGSHEKMDDQLRALQDSTRQLGSTLAEQAGEVRGLAESNDFLSHCYSGISGRVEQAKRVADDTHAAFVKFQHTAANQLDDIRKNGLPRLNSRLETLEVRLQRQQKEAHQDAENLAQVKLHVEKMQEALVGMEEALQLQENQFNTRVEPASTRGEGDTLSSMDGEAVKGRNKMEQLSHRLNQTKVELTDLANGLHNDLARRVSDLSTLLDAKGATIRNNSAALRVLEGGLSATNADVRSNGNRISELRIVQEQLVEQARVAETEIQGLFEFRKEATTKLQEHDAVTARLDLRQQSAETRSCKPMRGSWLN
ncbi:unnamed protein product [Effrenium voratum]|uniref:Uncharacterized protein n=1 Tax=Effrenium voratum TaxID=2562239 RepID=A0AA36MJW3_9DINO|nr:unnamed protein product [Effrenium voratum]